MLYINDRNSYLLDFYEPVHKYMYMNLVYNLFSREYNASSCQQERDFEESLSNSRRFKQLTSLQAMRLESLKISSKKGLSDTEFLIRQGIIDSLERGNDLRCIEWNLEELSYLQQVSYQAIELYLPTIAYILQKCTSVRDRAHQDLYNKVVRRFVQGLASQVSKAIRLYEQKLKIRYSESRIKKLAAERCVRIRESQSGTLSKIAKVALPILVVSALFLGLFWYTSGDSLESLPEEHHTPAQLLIRSRLDPNDLSQARQILLLDPKTRVATDCQRTGQQFKGLSYLFYPVSPDNNQASRILVKARNTVLKDLETRNICKGQ